MNDAGVITSLTPGRHAEFTAMFENAFTASDGREEGAIVAGLVRGLLQDTPPHGVVALSVRQGARIAGGAIFSRLTFGADARTSFLLSPLAVAPDAQGRGLGAALVTRGLDELRRHGVAAAFTYGDPDFYGRFGFMAADPALGRPPFTVHHPEGWLGRWLSDTPQDAFDAPARCVAAFQDPSLW